MAPGNEAIRCKHGRFVRYEDQDKPCLCLDRAMLRACDAMYEAHALWKARARVLDLGIDTSVTLEDVRQAEDAYDIAAYKYQQARQKAGLVYFYLPK